MSKKGSCTLTKTHLKGLNLERVQSENAVAKGSLSKAHSDGPSFMCALYMTFLILRVSIRRFFTPI